MATIKYLFYFRVKLKSYCKLFLSGIVRYESNRFVGFTVSFCTHHLVAMQKGKQGCAGRQLANGFQYNSPSVLIVPAQNPAGYQSMVIVVIIICNTVVENER